MQFRLALLDVSGNRSDCSDLRLLRVGVVLARTLSVGCSACVVLFGHRATRISSRLLLHSVGWRSSRTKPESESKWERKVTKRHHAKAGESV